MPARDVDLPHSKIRRHLILFDAIFPDTYTDIVQIRMFWAPVMDLVDLILLFQQDPLSYIASAYFCDDPLFQTPLIVNAYLQLYVFALVKIQLHLQ